MSAPELRPEVRRARGPRGLLGRGLTALGGLVLAFVLAEAGARLLLGARAGELAQELAKAREQALQLLTRPPREALTGMFQSHPYYGYTLKPKFDGRSAWGWRISTDRYGFRNGLEFDFDALPEDARVVGIFGGSAAFGWGIDGNEHTLAARLEEELAQRNGPAPIRVVNLALPAWHYPQQTIAFARLAERLDAVLAFDGWNELFVPLSNTFDYDARLPPDFPWSPFYSTLLDPGGKGQSLETYALLLRESEYEPDGWAAHSALYNWWRHGQSAAARRRAAAAVSTRPEESLWPGERRFADSPAGFGEAVEFGIGEYVKYARLLDDVARASGVQVLHVIQPFRHADPDVPIAEAEAPNFARVLFREGHPGLVYGRLRARVAEAYRALPAAGPVQLLDLAEALPPGTGTWIDVIHPSAEGVRQIAARLAQELEARGFLARLPEK